jgi:hypothetical protein
METWRYVDTNKDIERERHREREVRDEETDMHEQEDRQTP